MSSRRDFLKLAGAGLTAAGLAPLADFKSTYSQGDNPDTHKKDLFTLGIAGYTFYRISFEKAVAIMKQAQVYNLSLKDNFLPLSSDQDTIRKTIKRFIDNGINVYTVGVIYMPGADEVKKAFDYARAAGVKMIVAVGNNVLSGP